MQRPRHRQGVADASPTARQRRGEGAQQRPVVIEAVGVAGEQFDPPARRRGSIARQRRQHLLPVQRDRSRLRPAAADLRRPPRRPAAAGAIRRAPDPADRRPPAPGAGAATPAAARRPGTGSPAAGIGAARLGRQRLDRRRSLRPVFGALVDRLTASAARAGQRGLPARRACGRSARCAMSAKAVGIRPDRCRAAALVAIGAEGNGGCRGCVAVGGPKTALPPPARRRQAVVLLS